VEAERSNERKEDESELSGLYTVYTTSNEKKGIVVIVKLDGKCVDMQLDMGAAVSLMYELPYKGVPVSHTV